MTDTRWPRRVYGVGSEPDPRFSLANERTFLAWLRTALGLMAGGVALAALGSGSAALRDTMAVGLLAAGVGCALTAFGRWAVTERALRTGRPLPSLGLAVLLAVGLALAGLVASTLVLIR